MVGKITAEFYQNGTSDIDEGNHWVWLPSNKNVYWILRQAQALPAKSLFYLPCAIYSLFGHCANSSWKN